MIVVPVRDQNGVDLSHRLAGHRNCAHEMGHSSPQQWIGQEAAAVEVEQDGRVSDVFDRVLGAAPNHDLTVMPDTLVLFTFPLDSVRVGA